MALHSTSNVLARARLLIAVAVLGLGGAAQAVPFAITITNTGTNTAYPWSTGLLTLSPVIALGLTPQPGTPAYNTYVYANAHCNKLDAFCSGTCIDNGLATVLAARLGLTLGQNAWVVPALSTGATATVTIDAPAGSRLSYIAWVNNTSVFDDFVSMHPANDVNTLSVPLFDAAGNPLASVPFAIGGYDVNSVSATNGGGATCAQECPPPASACYVAPGNASVTNYPNQPAAGATFTVTTAGPATTTTAQVTYTLTYRNTTTAQARSATLTYTAPLGVTITSAPGGTIAGSKVTWSLGNLAAGSAAASKTVVVTLSFGGTTYHSASVGYTNSAGKAVNVTSNTVATTFSTPALATDWIFTDPAGHATDGLAVADFSATAGSEVLVVAPARGLSGPGRTFVLRSDTGLEVGQFSPGTGRNAMGLPLAEDLVAGGTLEYLFGEPLPAASNGALYARLGDTTAKWTSVPYGYAAYWNMGPSSANAVSAVAGNEVLEVDWDGDVKVLRGDTGAPLGSYNTWTASGDHAFGHGALADVDGDGTLEAVVAGYAKGTVTVLNAEVGPTMTVQWTSAGLRSLSGDAPYGSGPAIGDIDGDGKPEIVVATTGTTGDVYAFDPAMPTGSACEHRFRTGGGTTYSSPVIGDVDGSGTKSIVVMSSRTAVLSVLKAGTTGCAAPGGTVVWQHTLKAGDYSSFTPLLYDVNGDGVLDVIAASNTHLELIDVRARTVLASFDDPTAAFMPSGAVANADPASAVRELYVTGWKNSKVYRLRLPPMAISTTDWPTFMGGNARTGAR